MDVAIPYPSNISTVSRPKSWKTVCMQLIQLTETHNALNYKYLIQPTTVPTKIIIIFNSLIKSSYVKLIFYLVITSYANICNCYASIGQILYDKKSLLRKFINHI